MFGVNLPIEAFTTYVVIPLQKLLSQITSTLWFKDLSKAHNRYIRFKTFKSTASNHCTTTASTAYIS